MLEFVGDHLELIRLNDGAMLSIQNAGAIAFDSGETTIIAHNSEVSWKKWSPTFL